MNTAYHTVDQYISSFPTDVQALLRQMRSTVKAAAPGAEELISYGMPTYKLHGNLVHFAAFKNHIGFYPVPSGIAAFQKELEPYKSAKGSAQFPLTGPLPLQLVERIVKFRVKENEEKASLKKGKSGAKESLSALSAPAQRALANNGITTVKQLAKFTRNEVLSFHGMGKASLPKLQAALQQAGLSFRAEG